MVAIDVALSLMGMSSLMGKVEHPCNEKRNVTEHRGPEDLER